MKSIDYSDPVIRKMLRNAAAVNKSDPFYLSRLITRLENSIISMEELSGHAPK